MSGRIPYPRRACRCPRSGRRGLTALTAVLLLAGLLAMAVANWQIGLATERLPGQARHLAGVVEAEGYGLHHWLHAERIAGTVTAPATPRTLTAAERTRLSNHSAVADWRRSATDRTRVLLPRGWEIVHLIGAPDGRLPDGVVILRPSNALVAEPTWAATQEALDVLLGMDTGGIAEGLATTALATSATPFDATRDRAVRASRLARLDTRAVLRERHAGHTVLPMEADLDAGGNDLADIGALNANSGQLPTLTGACPGQPANTLCAASLGLDAGLTARDDTSLGPLAARNTNLTGTTAVSGPVRAGGVDVSGTVTTVDLTACADATVDLCGGGDLDIEAATGTPDWTEAAIFGDVIIRDGNRLTRDHHPDGGYRHLRQAHRRADRKRLPACLQPVCP